MQELLPIMVIVAGIAAVAVIILGIVSVRSERNLAEERLGRFLDDSASSASFLADIEEDDKPKKDERRALEVIDRAIANRPFAKRWRQQLARADLKLTVAEYAALHVVSVIGFFAGAWFILFRGDIIMSIVAGFIGLFFPRIYVSRATSKRLIRFEQQLPDTLGLWVNALRSGFSVLQAMEAISRDAPEPTATEFKRVVQEVQLGIDVEDALEHLLSRVESEDLDLVVTAVNIQREVGGNDPRACEAKRRNPRAHIAGTHDGLAHQPAADRGGAVPVGHPARLHEPDVREPDVWLANAWHRLGVDRAGHGCDPEDRKH